MADFIRNIIRRGANLPGLSRFAARVEDRIAWKKVAGTSAKLSALRAELAASKTVEEKMNFARRFFAPTQILYEIDGLVQLANREGAQNVGEIGTAQGGTSFLLTHAIERTKFIAAIDLRVRNQKLLRGLAPREVEFHAFEGSSYDPATVTRVGATLGSRKFDLLLIDGDHRYEGVRADYFAYRDYVHDGGLIAFHDIVSSGENEATDFNGRWAGGAPRFWKELKSQVTDSWEFVEDPRQRGFGLGVLRHRTHHCPAR